MVADPYRSGSHHRPDGMYGKFGTVGTGDNQRVNYTHDIGKMSSKMQLIMAVMHNSWLIIFIFA